MTTRLPPLSAYQPEIPVSKILEARRKRGGGPPVTFERALEIAGRLAEIDAMSDGPKPLEEALAIVAEYMELENELFGVGSIDVRLEGTSFGEASP